MGVNRVEDHTNPPYLFIYLFIYLKLIIVISIKFDTSEVRRLERNRSIHSRNFHVSHSILNHGSTQIR